VRANELGDLCTPCHTSDDPASTVAVEAIAVDTEEDRSLATLAACEIDRTGRAWGERDRDDLVALTHDGEGAMSPFEAKRLDVGAPANDSRIGHHGTQSIQLWAWVAQRSTLPDSRRFARAMKHSVALLAAAGVDPMEIASRAGHMMLSGGGGVRLKSSISSGVPNGNRSGGAS
jgi:hypothetical protein